MGRSPCCDENGLKKGPWTPEEDEKLRTYIHNHGHGSWRALPKSAGLNRCGKSCRLRWTNYLRPDIKRGNFSEEEERTILHWHSILGNKWSSIASHMSGRTDNEIKNFWNTHLKKKLIQMGIDPTTHQPRTDIFSTLPQLIALANNLSNHLLLDDHAIRLQAEAMHMQFLRSTTTAAPAISVNPCGNGLSFDAAVDLFCTAPPPIKENLGLEYSQPLLQLQPNQSQMLSQLSVGPHQVQDQAVAFSSNNPTPPHLMYSDSTSLAGSSGGLFAPNPPVVAEVIGSTTTSCGGGSPSSTPDWLADYNF